jgi:hypothetical protein
VRFIFAIVAFVVAAVMIMLGIAQRTTFLEPATTGLTATVKSGERYTVIEPSALTAHGGSQRVTISGADTIFMAYGRSDDVKAWLADDPYASVAHTRGSERLSVKERGGNAETDSPGTDSPGTEGTAAPTTGADEKPAESATPADGTTEPAEGANPAGSDLWLDEFTAEGTLTTTLNLPRGIALFVASDGTAPAPDTISIAWPVDNSTPWATPLMIGGGVVGALGLILYLWALLHLRRSRGPRRNLPRGPRMPRLPRAPRPKTIKASEITGSKRSITRSMAAPARSRTRSGTRAAPLLLISGLVLSGCSADFWTGTDEAPTASITATPDATAAPDAAKDVAPPAVTVPQLERIMRKTAVLTADADATLNADALATRFAGAALEQRLANYKIRAALPDAPRVPALPASPLTLTLPQQATSWPRVVLTVVQNAEDPTVAPTALVLRQESVRANYLVEYAVQLEAAAEVPDVAPATIGAPAIAPDSKLLVMPPNQVAAAYADILMQGEASPSFAAFQVDGDTFRAQVATTKEQQRAKLPTTASIEHGAVAATGEIVALATNDSGAIVAVSIHETDTVKPVEAGATVSPEPGPSKALSGVEATAKGIQSVYSDQLLFHVPAAGSKDKIVLLGFAQGLISSAELP